MPQKKDSNFSARVLPGLAKGFAFLLMLLLLLEGGLRLAGVVYGGSRASVFGDGSARAEAATVLCIGDSYTYGGNVTSDQAYPHRLWEALGKAGVTARVVNKGHCEYNSAQVLDEFGADLEKFHPKVVVLLAGSSDRWNLVGTEASDPRFIFRKDYDGEMERLPGSDGPAAGRAFTNPLLSARVYKMYRSIVENLRFRYLLKKAERIRAGNLAASYASGKLKDGEMLVHLEALFYRSRYEELFELAFSALESVSPGSDLFARDLSVYFILSASFRYQDKYSAAQTAARLERILTARPEFSGSEPFLKYLEYFRKHAGMEAMLEKRLEANLESLVKTAAAHKARLIIMNYPSTHALANRLLERAAGKHGLPFIDNHAKFSELIKTGGREKYLMGDDHATPPGHREMAALLLPEIVKALK